MNKKLRYHETILKKFRRKQQLINWINIPSYFLKNFFIKFAIFVSLVVFRKQSHGRVLPNSADWKAQYRRGKNGFPDSYFHLLLAKIDQGDLSSLKAL